MSALVGGLSGKEREQLDAAVLEYLKKVAPAAADAFAPAPPDAAAQPGALERKWVSVVRLQRRVLDLEAKAKAGGRATPPPGGSYAPRAPCAHALRGHRGAVTCAAASGGLAATGAEDGAIRLWDCASGAAAGSLGGHVDAVLALAFDDGGALLSCSADGRAAQESEIPNFKGSDLGHFLLVSADFWTSDHLSERSRSVDVFLVTRARGTLTLKRR